MKSDRAIALGRVATVVVAIACCARGLEVEEAIWGFDGKAMQRRIVPLSVLVSNPSAEPYQGVIRLWKSHAGMGRLGANLAVPVFLASYTSRWVQFYPYVNNEYHTWNLVWGPRVEDRRELAAPRLGGPAVVSLQPAGSVLAAVRGLKSFPEELFPPGVSATDALHAAVLDHVPRWEAARRQAFLDWLRRGGLLHLCRDAEGVQPEFTAELDLLNAPEQTFPVGAGCVVRHDRTARELDRSALASAGFATPEVQPGKNAVVHQFETSIFQALSKLVSPNHNWAMIYTLAVIYMVLVVPVNFLIGRSRRGTYWQALAFFAVAVVCCGFALNMVGRRGYGETSRVHSLTYARWLGEDHYDATQWLNVFATRGDEYQVTHPSEHSIYSTCQEAEAVNGVVHSGKGGSFTVDIPVYSRRALLHRGKLSGPSPEWQVAEWEGQQGGAFRRIKIQGDASSLGSVNRAYAYFRGSFYRATVTGDGVECIGARRQNAEEFCDQQQIQQFAYNHYMGARRATSESEVFDRLDRPVALWATGSSPYFVRKVVAPEPPGDRLHLFVYATTPTSFHLSNDRFGTESGRTLYHFILRRPQP